MTPDSIAHTHAWEALDSRGRPTVACRVTLQNGAQGRAIAPSGASTGRHEALEQRDGGDRYGGWGVSGAVRAVNEEYAPLIAGMSVSDRVAIDDALEAHDGTDNLGRLGANAALAVSLAVTIAHAASENAPLWSTLTGPREASIPMPMVNILSGGAHAGRAVDIQDFLAVPVGAESFTEAIEQIARVRAACATLLDARGGWSALVADEGGLAARLDSNEAVLALLSDGIDAAGFTSEDMGIALDVAATQLVDGDSIVLAGQGDRLSVAEWLDLVASWVERYPIVSIEDIVGEDDWDGSRTATAMLPHVQMLGDDTFATNLGRVRRGIEEDSANSVLVKVNQAGTVSRAERVVFEAIGAGFETVVSARSGDTEDNWLADLAVGWGARQIKVGSTMRSERTAKWNRLLELESDGTLPFAGRTALAGQPRNPAL
ncbi:phosphopyruvate hydratase [Demequina aurantiaca]|uniref:phosphopyruvate hydratase n=1 Tax=Demequina aurantiaca TaxID=676200 RepID=UPI0007827508|nr:phosphopyruvate hydratase [Demequina aurantiaca]